MTEYWGYTEKGYNGKVKTAKEEFKEMERAYFKEEMRTAITACVLCPILAFVLTFGTALLLTYI